MFNRLRQWCRILAMTSSNVGKPRDVRHRFLRAQCTSENLCLLRIFSTMGPFRLPLDLGHRRCPQHYCPSARSPAGLRAAGNFVRAVLLFVRYAASPCEQTVHAAPCSLRASDGDAAETWRLQKIAVSLVAFATKLGCARWRQVEIATHRPDLWQAMQSHFTQCRCEGCADTQCQWLCSLLETRHLRLVPTPLSKPHTESCRQLRLAARGRLTSEQAPDGEGHHSTSA